jgi:protein-tyrosine phosphatase
MSLRPVALPFAVPGTLWLAAMPGRSGPWAAFETQARRARLALVVCLTPTQEVAQLSPQYNAAIVQGMLPFRWVHLPMPNFGVPDDAPAFRAEIGRVADALRNGDAVMLHCAAGLGRTGTAAACVLKALGLEVEDAMAQVRAAGSNPQNARQSGLIDWF